MIRLKSLLTEQDPIIGDTTRDQTTYVRDYENYLALKNALNFPTDLVKQDLTLVKPTIKKTPIVVFVSGLEYYETVAEQTARIRSGMPGFQVVSFKWNQSNAVIEYLEQNQPAALILYSKSVEDTKTYSAYIKPEKIFAIEPYKPPSLRGIPAKNMWKHPRIRSRGSGIQGNDVPDKYLHAPPKSDKSVKTVLDYVAPLIAARIRV